MEFQLLTSAQRACDWANSNDHIGVLLGPRLKKCAKKRPQQQRQQAAEEAANETDETGSQQSSVDRGCYRLDSGNSLDSGLECCSSSIGSLESDAKPSRDEVTSIEAAIAKLKTTQSESAVG